MGFPLRSKGLSLLLCEDGSSSLAVNFSSWLLLFLLNHSFSLILFLHFPLWPVVGAFLCNVLGSTARSSEDCVSTTLAVNSSAQATSMSTTLSYRHIPRQRSRPRYLCNHRDFPSVSWCKNGEGCSQRRRSRAGRRRPTATRRTAISCHYTLAGSQ